jgi:hypothetical protein
VRGEVGEGRWRERGRERGALRRLWSPAVVAGARRAGDRDDDGRWGRWTDTPAACRLLASSARMRVSSPRRRSPERSSPRRALVVGDHSRRPAPLFLPLSPHSRVILVLSLLEVVKYPQDNLLSFYSLHRSG